MPYPPAVHRRKVCARVLNLFRKPLMQRAALGAIVALALALRLFHIGFGLPAINDPDELMFELGAVHMLRTGTLNPGWFGHPATTTMYLLALCNIAVYGTGRALGWFHSQREFVDAVFVSPSLLILPGRIAMAAFGAASVWLTGRLATALFDRRAGLVAALILAVSPVAVHWSQIIRSDVMATTFMLACLLATLRHARGGGWRDLIVAAVWLGTAIATKWPFAVGGVAMIAVIGWQLADGSSRVRDAAVRLAAFIATMLCALLVISPYLVIARDTVARNLQGEAQTRHLGATGGTLAENLAWYLQGPMVDALGVAGIALAAAGVVFAARRPQAAAMIVPVTITFALLIGSQHIVWERWIIPLLPLVAMLAGAALAEASRKLERGTAWRGALACTIAAGLIALPLGVTAFREAQARANDTRQIASAWAAVNIPAGSTVFIEHFGFDLYSQPWRVLFPMGEAGCVDARALLAGKFDNAVIERARAGRSNIDYGTVATARLESCRADYAILSQADRYAAEAADFPVQAKAYRELIQAGRTVAVIRPAQYLQNGPVVRIVRFGGVNKMSQY